MKIRTNSPSIQSTLIVSGPRKVRKDKQVNAEVRRINTEALRSGTSYGKYVAAAALQTKKEEEQ